MFVRSGWEANFVRYYRFLGIEFEYEKKEFEFEGLKRGNRFYKPDFYLPKTDRYVELKGFLDKDSKTKLSRLWKYHPEVANKLQIVVARVFIRRSLKLTKVASALLEMGYRVDQLMSYAKLESQCRGLVPGWE
jgi:hypothetical protein